MTTKQLSYKAPPQLAVAIGATTPNPGVNGVTIWSTIENSTLQWNGSNWGKIGTSGNDLIQWEKHIRGDSGWGSVFYFRWGTSSIAQNGNTSSSEESGIVVFPSGNDSSYVNTRIAVDLTSTGTTYNGMFVGSNSTDIFRQRGVIFDAAMGLSAFSTHAGFIGLFKRTTEIDNGIYSSLDNSVACIGIGKDEGDAATAAYLMVGNGTTRTKTLLTRTGSGYGASSGLTFRVQISIAPAAAVALITVIDLSNNYPCLSNYSVSLSTFPTSQSFCSVAGSASGVTSSNVTVRFYEFSYAPYPGEDLYAQSASNISGNAATASALLALTGIPQGGANNGQVLTWNGSQYIPQTPVGGSSADPLILTSQDYTATAIGQVKLFRKNMGGRQIPAFVGPNGVDSALQPHLARNKISFISPAGNATTITAVGGVAPTATGTATASIVTVTNTYTRLTKIEYLVTTAATTAVAGWRAAAAQYTIGAAQAWNGGFHYSCRFGPATGVATASNRCFVGLGNSTAAPTDVLPSTITNIVGVGWDSTDTNIQIMHRGTGAITKIDTTIAVPLVDRTSVFELTMFSPPGLTQIVYFDFRDIVNDITVSGTINSNMPTNTTLLAPRGWMSAGGTSSVIGIGLMNQYIETDF